MYPNPNYLFWFGGKKIESPTVFYPTIQTLFLANNLTNSNGTPYPIAAKYGPFTWTITAGADKVEFWDGSTNTSLGATAMSADGSIKVHSIGKSQAMDDVTIQVVPPSYLGATYPLFHMTVYAPYRDISLAPGYACKAGGSIGYTGFSCSVFYRTLDQLGNIFGYQNGTPNSLVTANENWTNTGDASGVNWETFNPGPCGGSKCNNIFPFSWTDQILFANFILAVSSGGTCAKPNYNNPPTQYQPMPIPPATPQGKCTSLLATQTGGGWWIGSSVPGQGMQVQKSDWLIYLDHGRHNVISSPP